MPVINRKLGAHSSTNERLRDRLVAEWQRAQDAEEPRPTIVEETDDSGNVVHVYVVWDAWANLEQEQRSAIITDAFWEAFGEKGLALTVAMGLLPEEAEKMGLEFAE